MTFSIVQLIVRIITFDGRCLTIDESSFLARGSQCNKLVNDLLHFTRREVFVRLNDQSLLFLKENICQLFTKNASSVGYLSTGSYLTMLPRLPITEFSNASSLVKLLAPWVLLSERKQQDILYKHFQVAPIWSFRASNLRWWRGD